MNGGRSGSRAAQLQTLEPIIVVVFLAMIIGFLLMFYLRLSGSQQGDETRLQENIQDLEMLKRAARMPELACQKSETGETYCIDLYKAQAFKQLMADAKTRTRYYPLLGASRINITTIDLEGGTETFTLYSNINASKGVRPTVMYTTVYDPLTDTRKFAILMIERQTS